MQPSLSEVVDGKYALTAEEMAQLFAKLDHDRTGTVSMGELVDVFVSRKSNHHHNMIHRAASDRD